MDIVLVGNARSLLERDGLGDVIDRFGVVVRFNNYATMGFERFVGAKTDWWARNETDDVLARHSDRFGKILLRLQGEDSAVYARGAADLLPQLLAQHADTPIEIIPRVLFAELIAECGFAHAPLTGTLVAAHLLKTFPKIHICGFDNLVGGPGTLRHYYSDGNIIGDWTTYHEPDKERAFFARRIADGRIVIL